MEEKTENIEFWGKTWFSIFMSFVFAPVGIYFIWKNKNIKENIKIILSVVFGIYFFLIWLPVSFGIANGSFRSNEVPTSGSVSSTNNLTAESITQSFVSAGLPVGSVISYNEKTDVNGILGKPKGYTSKVNFSDTRVPQSDAANPVGGTVEVFKNAEDAKARYEYVTKFNSGENLLSQHNYLHDEVCIRIDGALTKEHADEYNAAYLKSNGKKIEVANQESTPAVNSTIVTTEPQATPIPQTTNTEKTETKTDNSSQMTKYDYKQFVDDTIKTFEPSAEISFPNYMEWDLDGTKYAKTTFKSKGLDHEFIMRFSADTAQLFYVSIDGQKVFSNVDAEMAYMDSQPK